MDFNSFIGKTCRVISKQNVRYSGTLQLIDPVERKIRVTDVRCHGTEDRPAEMFMPAIQAPFGLVEFNVNDLKDLRFDDDDNAATAAPAPSAPAPQPPQPQYPPPPQSQQIPQQKPPQQLVPPASFSAEKALPPGFSVYQANSAVAAPNGSVPAANTDSLNQAMGAMKLNNGTAPVPRTNGANTVPQSGGRGAGRGRGRGRGGSSHHNHHQQQARVEIKIPASDFDFEASNKLFDKTSTATQYIQQQPYAGAAFNSSPAEKEKTGRISPALAGTLNGGKKDGEVVKKESVYNPSKSFFDNISSDLTAKKPARAVDTNKAGAQDDGGESTRGRGRGRGGLSYGKMRRDEERERNVETFGEPGGVGLLGPGSYVGGYGGYRGRRKRGGGASRGGRGGGASDRGGAPRAVVHTN